MSSTYADAAPRQPCNPARRSPAGLLLVVEGPHDIEFLRRISRMLHRHEPAVPDLAHLDDTGRLVFIPVGGGRLAMWVSRFAALGLPEVHLYDRESSPETTLRERIVAKINRRPGCRGLLTTKRSLEHYLHPATITEIFGLEVSISDHEPLADLLAQRLYERHTRSVSWSELPKPIRSKRRNRVKHRLHTRCVDRMTPQRLAESDPDGDLVGWLAEIRRLLDG